MESETPIMDNILSYYKGKYQFPFNTPPTQRGRHKPRLGKEEDINSERVVRPRKNKWRKTTREA